MKRILLPFVLIITPFVCHAKSDQEQFENLRASYARNYADITTTQINDTLNENQFLRKHPGELIALAEQIQTTRLTTIRESIEFEVDISKSLNPGKALPYSPTIDNCKALLNIIVFAHQYAASEGLRNHNLMPLDTVQDLLHQFEPDQHFFFQRRTGYAIGLMFVGLIACDVFFILK